MRERAVSSTDSMQVTCQRRSYVPVALAAAGGGFAVLAVLDKLVGVAQRPLQWATLAYASLFVLLGWAVLRGIQWRPERLVRLSVYAAFVLLNLLTAAYVLAWRLSADPTPVILQSQLARGDALLADGEKDAAHLSYLEAYKRFPTSFAVLMRLGAVNYQIADFERARRYFTRALEHAPAEQRWRVLNDLGQTYWKLQQPEDAIEHYERARKEGLPASETLEWHYRLGWAYFDARRYDAAIEHYEVVGEAGERYAAASYYNIACAYAQKMKVTPEASEKDLLARRAVDSLRKAWDGITNEEEAEALRMGILGSEAERDPELAPLRGTSHMAAFLREIDGTRK